MKRRLETKKRSIWIGLIIAVMTFTLATVNVEAKAQIVTPASAIRTIFLPLTPHAISSNSPIQVTPNPVVEEENPFIKGTEFTISPYEQIWIPTSLPNNTVQCLFSHNAYRTAGGVDNCTSIQIPTERHTFPGGYWLASLDVCRYYTICPL